MIYSVHTVQCRRVRMPCLSKCLRLLVRVANGARGNVPLLMTFFSAHHSPRTVNMNARELVIGTVRLSSTAVSSLHAPVPCYTHQPFQ
jgi:hypothetical protein